MRVLIVASVSAAIAEIATLTLPNKFEYCLRHGYSLLAANKPYSEAVADMVSICGYLDQFDLVWTLDADAVITNMSRPVHELECLGPHVTACEEGIVDWNWINCGSVIWRDTLATRYLLTAITADERRWQPMACGWQTWLGQVAKDRPDLVTVAPLRSFNSCVWTNPGGGPTVSPGSHWQPGDLVWHPCSVQPLAARVAAIRDTLANAVQR